MEKRKHVMPGSPFQKWKNREVAVGIGSHIHVEVVTEEIAFPVGVPSPSYSPAVNNAVCNYRKDIRFLYICGCVFSLLSGGADRSAVPGKGQMVGNDQPFTERKN